MKDFPYSMAEIAQITGGKLVTGNGKALVGHIEYDSRQLPGPENTLFVALRSGNRDGHRFVEQAYAAGVRNFLVDIPVFLEGEAQIIQVSDTLKALQTWAAAHRKKSEATLIGITGSNGKTIVKEWLASLLEHECHLIKSPKSFNSQLGVPLSVFQLNSKTELGIIEAGISQTREMGALQAIIQPDFCIFTHFGDAHSEGFSSEAEKLVEKLLLCQEAKEVWVTADDSLVLQVMRQRNLPILTVGYSESADLRVVKSEPEGKGTRLLFSGLGKKIPLWLPFQDAASLENAFLTVLAALRLGYDPASLNFDRLSPVSMRLEMISENPEITILNDAYNADKTSVLNAFSRLERENSHPRKMLVLSDLVHQGQNQRAVQKEILQEAVFRFSAENILLVGPVFKELAAQFDIKKTFTSTEELLSTLNYDQFRHHVILLKGARKFELERLIPYLSRRVNATAFQVNLDAMVRNFRRFKAHLAAHNEHKVRMMVMVKAFSYGSGSWELARTLEKENVDYLAVAYLSGGIELRSKGIETPIMVMNPDPMGLAQLFRFSLEPEIYSLEILKNCLKTARRMGQNQVPVHLKLDTGMGRLGFTEAQIPGLINFLKANPRIQVRSFLSHLADADNPESDSFTRAQINKLNQYAQKIESEVPFQQKPLRHILNTAGIIRFPQFAGDMVRLGIGVYGISPVPGFFDDLEEIGSLTSVISQIHVYPAGTSVGYGRSQFTDRESKIATIPIGYADGIPRRLSNGQMSFLVAGKRAPIFGRVCMDMLMLDVTEIPEAKAGSEVVLIGKQNGAQISVKEFAEKSDTIPYEILTGISPRVRRLYVNE